ncbi:hypothetical protein SDC9_194431 [bioreactor metagenome]|uniref:Thymidylate kinase n=1 Tax=bioreactor metagenome TaxID=1076179 RepID=A0A645I7S8_9ZZZZ
MLLEKYSDRIVKIDASQDIESVFLDVKKHLMIILGIK